VSSSLRIAVSALLAGLAGSTPGAALGQQVADTSYAPALAAPAYPAGQGPLVLIDEGHFNFHTASGRYRPFADLLRRDGYSVRPSRGPFSPDSLRPARVLVIANALGERNRECGDSTDWSLPNPSAFTEKEVGAVRDWVQGGGSLLLIADHMPFGGAASRLAAAFGARMDNGFAGDGLSPGTLVFRRSDGSLADHPVTRGRDPGERIDSVATFTGQAFQVDSTWQGLLTFPPGIVSLHPQAAWQFTPETPRNSVAGWQQGAVSEFGRGRVAVFGEAAMFSAQVSGPRRRSMGMNAPEAGQNARFLLNLVRWLAGP
jgi:hypothetical protein